MANNGKERAQDTVNEDENEQSHSEDDRDEEDVENGPDTAGSSTSVQKPKKNKKKKSKAAKLLNALKGQREVPQELVDTVMEKVREQEGHADESEVRAALEQLKIGGLIEGKAGLFGRGKKDMGDHKVRFSNLRDAHRIEQHAVLGNATSASSWYIVSSCIITNLLINLRRGRTSRGGWIY